MKQQTIKAIEAARYFVSKHGKKQWLCPVVPDFHPSMHIGDIRYVVEEQKWVKCIIFWGMRDYEGNWKKKKSMGISTLNPDDKWDESMGKKIAFGKAMTDLFQLSNRKVF